jgi:hypothetical protein
MDRDKFLLADTQDRKASCETPAPVKSTAQLIDDLVKERKARDMKLLASTMRQQGQFSPLTIVARPGRRSRD